jgi:hypothetical protein
MAPQAPGNICLPGWGRSRKQAPPMNMKYRGAALRLLLVRKKWWSSCCSRVGESTVVGTVIFAKPTGRGGTSARQHREPAGPCCGVLTPNLPQSCALDLQAAMCLHGGMVVALTCRDKPGGGTPSAIIRQILSQQSSGHLDPGWPIGPSAGR